MATHSSVLAWRIPGMAEPGGLCRLWGRTESDTTVKEYSADHHPLLYHSTKQWVHCPLIYLTLNTKQNLYCLKYFLKFQFILS